MKRSPQRIIIAVIVLVFCALVLRLEFWAKQKWKHVDFVPTERELLSTIKPNLIFIGNSMLGLNVNEKDLEQKLGSDLHRRINAHFIVGASLHSAWFYLVLKNQVLPVLKPGVPIVILDYEDFFLRSDAGTQVQAKREELYRRTMNGKEKVFRRKLGRNAIYFADGFPYLFSQRFKIKRQLTTQFIRTSLDILGAWNLVDPSLPRVRKGRSVPSLFHSVFKELNFRNGIINLQHENLGRQLTVADDDQEFAEAADRSFLPNLLAMSDTHPIIIVQSSSNPELVLLKNNLVPFNNRLERYVEEHHGFFINLNRVDALQHPELMLDSRHFKKDIGVDLNTKVLSEEIEKVLVKIQQDKKS